MSIRISRFRIDMGANPIKNLGQGTSTTDAARRDEVVLMTGDQTVAGVKTFSSFPITPSSAPTTDYQVANKKYTTDTFQPLLSSGQTDKTRQFNLLPAGAVIPATSGCGLTQTNGTNKSYWTLDFDTTADEYCFFHFTVPDQYDGGNVKFDIWCKSTATSGNVAFIITTADVADAATYDASLGTTITFSAKTVDGSAGDAFVASATADPGWTASRLVAMRLRRDTANDNAAADINVLMIEVEYEVT